MRADPRPASQRLAIAWRICWTLASLVVVQAFVCGVSAAPSVFAWRWLASATRPYPMAGWIVMSAAIAPLYILFALVLMGISPLVTRLLGWRTPPDAAIVIADMDWRLLGWVRYGASIHVARVLAGTLFRGTPFWAAHLRLHGARLGRRVYVNSVSIGDYNLLECGHDVVIGEFVHLSGHTVEGGVVKTARIRIGDNVTIGVGTVVEIGAVIESNLQIGALSFVPKHARLTSGRIYAGAPAAPIE